MTDIYCGKDNIDPEFQGLQKCSAVMAKLEKHLHSQPWHKLYFNNWFTTLELFHYLIFYCAVGTIRANRLHGCPLSSNKDLEKRGRGEFDYRVDSNSGVTVTKWLDNKAVLVGSNYVGIAPVGAIKRWDKTSNSYKDIPCPKIALAYDKNMGGADLANRLISLYRIKAQTKRWYIKVFWHLTNISKVNVWNLYRRHSAQYEKPRQQMLCLLKFSTALGNALIHANKPVHVNKPGRTSKHASCANSESTQSKRASVPTQCSDIRYDQIGHWPEPVDKKDRCRLCQAYSRTKCSNCILSLCLLKDRNCFKDFHHK